MGWKELNGQQLQLILHHCEERAADLSLLKTTDGAAGNTDYGPPPGVHDSSSSSNDTSSIATFVCEKQRDTAVLDKLALCKIFQLSVQVFSQSVGIFDRFLSVIKVRPKFVNCISLSCVYLALQLEQSTTTTSSSDANGFGHPGAHDINRFISASESRCTYSDVVRMSGVIAKKLNLDLHMAAAYPTLYDAFVVFNEAYSSGCFGAILDFYASCLCCHELVVMNPKILFLAILGQFLRKENFLKLKHELQLECHHDLKASLEKVNDAYNIYSQSGKHRRSNDRLGFLKKYIFKISQRTGQVLMNSKSRILALASANNLAPIQEESIALPQIDGESLNHDEAVRKKGETKLLLQQEEEEEEDCEYLYSSVVLSEVDDTGGPPLRKKRKTQKYSKVPLWFGFSSHASARASKPYYQHLVSSWSPWNVASESDDTECGDTGCGIDGRQLLSVFLIN